MHPVYVDGAMNPDLYCARLNAMIWYLHVSNPVSSKTPKEIEQRRNALVDRKWLHGFRLMPLSFSLRLRPVGLAFAVAHVQGESSKHFSGGFMQSKASAVWQGGLKDGSGQVSTASGVLSNTPYNFQMRFEGAKGTTPEEMIAAAHAGCFAMAFSAQLGEAKITPKKI